MHLVLTELKGTMKENKNSTWKIFLENQVPKKSKLLDFKAQQESSVGDCLAFEVMFNPCTNEKRNKKISRKERNHILVKFVVLLHRSRICCSIFKHICGSFICEVCGSSFFNKTYQSCHDEQMLGEILINIYNWL